MKSLHKTLVIRFAACVVSGVAALTATVPSQAQAYTYSIDGGQADVGFGVGGDNDIVFLNQFSVTPGNNVIGSVSLAIGTPGALNSPLLGTSVSTLIYGDPNGDGEPSDATLLEIGTGVITSVDANVFQTFSFANPITLTGTSFFVGFLVTAPDGTLPGALDGGSQDGYTPVPDRSFFAFDDPGQVDLNDLTNNYQPVTSVDSIELSGNWLIRANTTVPEPSTYALLSVGLGAGIWALRRRRVTV